MIDARYGARLIAVEGSTSWWSRMSSRIAEQHFWFSILLSAGLLACLGTKTIDAPAGCSLLGMVIGHYLGRAPKSASSEEITK